MRNRTPKLLALALAAVMTMGMTVSAATINVNSGDTMQNNNGIVMYNYGEVINNNSVVRNNHGTVQNNNNNGIVMYNYGEVINNNNAVQNNHGIVQNNNGIVQNNYGTVKKVDGGYVVNNFGGDVEGGAINQYCELPIPQNFSYEGAKKSDDRWWINFLATVTIKADDGYYFESASISEGLGTITVADDHKSCTLSNVTGSLANGGLTLDVQEGEYTPEQPEPEPEPEPTQPPTQRQPPRRRTTPPPPNLLPPPPSSRWSSASAPTRRTWKLPSGTTSGWMSNPTCAPPLTARRCASMSPPTTPTCPPA